MSALDEEEQGTTARERQRPYLASCVPLAFAHRGFSPPGTRVENTVRAFRAAVEQGFSYLETDVRTSRDGVVFAFHDEDLDRISDGHGSLSSKTAAELDGVRVGGEPIPRFEGLLREFPQTKFNVDIKDEAAVAPMAELIERYDAHDRVLVASFSDRRRRRLLALLSKPVATSGGVLAIAIFVLCSPWMPMAWLQRLLPRVDCVQVPIRSHGIRVVSAKSLARAHQLGLEMHVWTVNSQRKMRGLLDLGVDGVMTDRADLLAEVMLQRGYWGSANPTDDGAERD